MANSMMKNLRNLLWLLVIAALGFLIYQTYLKSANSTNESALQSAKLPTFAALKTIPSPPTIAGKKFLDKNGKEIELAQINGKLKFVNIWATWCPPCVKEMPELASFSERHKGELVVIPISIDKEESADKARAKLAELSGGKLEFYSDPKINLPFALNVQEFPTTIIYDENNNELARIAAAPDWNSKEADNLVASLSANHH